MSGEAIRQLVDRYLSVSFFVMKRAVSLIKKELDQEITTDQFFLLRYIKQWQRCTSTELAAAFEVNKSAITAMTNRLVEKKLLKRRRDPNDRRVVYLSLTESGNAWLKSAEQKIDQLVQSIMTQFHEREIEAVITTFEKLAEVLRKMEEEV